jgi:hypothetical protein
MCTCVLYNIHNILRFNGFKPKNELNIVLSVQLLCVTQYSWTLVEIKI